MVPGWGLRATASGGGSLISKVAVQGPSTTNYEVNMTVALNASGGDYVEYVRATTNALTGTGSYFSVELQNPTFNSATGACTATLAAYQSVSSVVTKLYSTPVACHNGMQVRTAILGTVAYIILDGNTMWVSGVTVASGMPGIGGRNMPSANAISLVMLGPWDNVAPSAVNAETIAATVNATSLYAQWQGAVDNANGVGVALYAIERNDGAWFYTYDASFSDLTVQPGTTYTYGIIAQDYHRNDSTTTSFTITTPPAGTLDPRRVGVRPTGSYWGGAGEHIDLLSGNVNFSLPLITAVGRGGLTAAFNLSYNSQNWVTGSAGLELMGVDTGYGFGWQLMLGSLMPVYSAAADPVPVQYYLFTDSTGAQYHLNQNSGSVWSSSESVYVWYDANANLLHFRNGTFWVMGCASAGGEPDAGTLYPTVVEDTNGNQIIITYMPGVAANWINSSARISIIEDARAVPYQSGGDQLYESYTFSYVVGGNGLSYLQYINSWVGTPETYSFGIAEGQPLYSPTGVSYGTTSLLSTVTTYGLGYTYNFTYDTTLNDGDLTQAEFPQGGHLRWTYANLAFGTQTLRYAASRYLLSTLGGSESTYTLSPGTNTMTLDDPTGSEKYWVFNASGTTPAGLVSELRERAYHGATQAVRHEYYTWAQDATSLNMYLGTLKTVLDEGQAYAQTTQTVQTQDSYGNVLTSQVYDYGNLNTPARTYSNTYAYQGNGSYASWYIYNRLSTSTLTSVTPNITLVSNTYDANTLSLPEGNPREWDAANYGSLCYYRGNVTQSNTPGKTINTFYDTTGTVTQQNDNNGHSVSVNTSSLTNFTLPDTLSPNGASTLQTQAAYNTPNYFPASIAGPGQTLNNGTTGTAAYTSYDSYGRIAYTLAPSQAAGQTGAQTNYTYGYSTSTGWTTTATTTNSGSGSHYTTTTLDGLGRTASVQSGTGSTPISEVDTAYAPCACSPMGKMYQRSQPYAPPNSSPPATIYTYDALGPHHQGSAGRWRQLHDVRLPGQFHHHRRSRRQMEAVCQRRVRQLGDGPGAGPHGESRSRAADPFDVSRDQRAHRYAAHHLHL